MVSLARLWLKGRTHIWNNLNYSEPIIAFGRKMAESKKIQVKLFANIETCSRRTYITCTRNGFCRVGWKPLNCLSVEVSSFEKNKQPQSISVVKWERIASWNVCRGLWDLRGLLPHRIEYYAANCVGLDAIHVLLIECDSWLHIKWSDISFYTVCLFVWTQQTSVNIIVVIDVSIAIHFPIELKLYALLAKIES